MNKGNQQGIAHLGLIVVILVALALVAFAFWRIQNGTTDEANGEPQSSEVEESDDIQDASELEAIENELQETDIDAELNTSELDEVIE